MQSPCSRAVILIPIFDYIVNDGRVPPEICYGTLRSPFDFYLSSIRITNWLMIDDHAYYHAAIAQTTFTVDWYRVPHYLSPWLVVKTNAKSLKVIFAY